MSENSAGRRGGDGQARRKERMLRANKKPGDTYFRECSHYHRPGVLNYCVRNGNRCFHHGMVARKSTTGGKTRPCLTFWLFEQEWHDLREMCDLRFAMLEERRSRQSDIFNLQSNISQSSALTLLNQ
jgi:hypothetical protein